VRDVPINNPYVEEALNNFLWYYENKDLVMKTIKRIGNTKSRKHFTSKKYLDNLVFMGRDHNGYPEDMCAYELKADKLESNIKDNTHAAELIKRYSDYNTELCSILCTKNNALTTMYPPNGFIGWHNNANASAYNLIFSWSETGDGHFQYIDGETGEIIIMKDRKGWNCKAGYFGSYNEHESKLVYHSAETDCWRMTISYMFNRTEMSANIQEETIQEIMDI
jgi:hypothetical protein